jgi:predicted porin
MTYLGLNGFTPIGENTFIYGQVTRSIKLTDSSITDGTKETFTGYEAGYGYVLNKSTQLTVGYRNQKFSTNNSNYVSNTLPGIIFGINITP